MNPSFKKSLATTLASSVLALTTMSAMAVDQGDWLVRFGAANVSPNDKAGGFSGAPTVSATVEDNTQPFVNLSYMWKENVAFEVLAATPFTHDIYATGGATGKVGSTDHLPPTFSVQYHFSPKASTRPYVGAGINYTTFFGEETTGALAGTTLSLDDSVGLAVQAGVDIDINNDWFFNADVRYINIETTATSSALGTIDVEINPYVFSIGAGTRF